MRRIHLLSIAILAILIAGCTAKAYEPEMSFSLSKSSLTLKPGELSEPVEVTVKKLDERVIPSKFNIALTTPNPGEIAFYKDGNEPISTIQTLPFTYQGDQTTYPFRIKGKKSGSTDVSVYKLFIHLEYKAKPLGDAQEIEVTVK